MPKKIGHRGGDFPHQIPAPSSSAPHPAVATHQSLSAPCPAHRRRLALCPAHQLDPSWRCFFRSLRVLAGNTTEQRKRWQTIQEQEMRKGEREKEKEKGDPGKGKRKME